MIRKLSPLQWLLLLPAFLLLLLSLGFSAIVLALAPPVVSLVAGFLVLVVGLWFFLVRRRGSGPASEAGLIGRQTTKDGLL